MSAIAAAPALEPRLQRPTPAGPAPSRVSSSGRLRLNQLGLGWIWLAGAMVVLLRTARGALGAIHVVRCATPIDDPRGSRALARARDRLAPRMRLEPELKQSRRAPVPFAWPGRTPKVVLPACGRRWDDERLTVVLVHELVHLLRRDALALAIGRAAAAMWWFHPLVHLLERWARKECERAADDAVLRSGSRASEYAEHLLAIGRALTRPLSSGVTLTMSNSPDLKNRLLAILSADRSRRALTRRLAAGTSLAALACAVVLAGARFAPQAQAQEPEPDVKVKVGKHHAHDHDSDSDSSSDSDSNSDSDSDSEAGHADWHQAYDAYRHGRYDEAIDAFEKAAAAGYRPAVAIYNAACSLSLSGRTEEALSTLRRALDLGLDRPELLAEDSDLDPLRGDQRFQALVDEAFERAGERRDPIEHYRYRSAQEALDVLRETGSQDAGAWSKAGTKLLMLRQLDDAAEALENAGRYAREAPSTALYNLACAHALAGRPSDALDALERSIEAGYSDPEHMRQDPDLASLRDSADFERLVDLAHALDLDRFQHDWWQGHGKAKHKHHGGHGRDHRYSAEMWAPAIEHFRAFVEAHPSLGVGWFRLGYALHYSERFDEAIDAFERARQLGFRPATSAYNIACGLSMQNRVDDALAALEQAIELGLRGDLDHDSDLDNLRQDPRFRSLRLKVRLDRES